jgi:glycosyltransferase involved in cell wall biosynthesis
MRVAQVNYRFDAALADPDELLERYTTLTGWSRALLDGGAERVSVVQRFHRDATVTRNGVEYLFRASGVSRAVAGMRPDITHVNGLDSPVRMAMLRLRLPATTRIVVQDHASHVATERGNAAEQRVRRAARRAAMRAADAFFFTAEALAEPWRAAGLISPQQPVYEVLEAGTTLRPIDRAEARRLSGVLGAPALLWVGRLNAAKDPLTVLDGFERSLARLPGAVLTMVYSETDLLSPLEQRVAASPALRSRVTLAGQVPHRLMPAYYSAADVFVLGSHHEGSGYALIEACACGNVPVVTSIPTFQAITGNGRIGVLWAIGDASAFANALAFAADDDLPSARARSIDHFERALSWPAVGRQAMKAYHDVLARARPLR